MTPPSYDIIGQLHQKEGALHKREQLVASFILNNLESAVHFTLVEIAKHAGVSVATVNRFCQSLGCEGFKDFKILLAQHVAINKQYIKRAKERKRSADELVNYVFDSISDAIMKIQSTLDPDVLDQAISAISNCNRILFLGLGGGSTNVAKEAANRFFRIGIPSESEEEGYKQRMLVSTFGPNDLVFAISATGLPKELIDCVGIAKLYGAESICLTRPDSPLSEVCDMSIIVDCPEDQDIYKPTATRYVFLAIIDVLATGVARANPDKTIETLRRVRSSVFSVLKSTRTQPIGD